MCTFDIKNFEVNVGFTVEGSHMFRGKIGKDVLVSSNFHFHTLLWYGDSSQWLVYVIKAYLCHDLNSCVCSGGNYHIKLKSLV